MSEPWRILRVELVDGPVKLRPPPGRDFLIGPTHTFGDLADAIDTAFARWDRSHLHEFTLEDGRRIGLSDPDDPDVIDEESLAIVDVVPTDNRFGYVFDLGDYWDHRCRFLEDVADPEDEFGALPLDVVPIMGWGSIPDQYGREGPDG